MALITLQEFADLHGVKVQSIRAKNFKNIVTKYGKKLISDKTKYEPRPDSRRKPSKRK